MASILLSDDGLRFFAEADRDYVVFVVVSHGGHVAAACVADRLDVLGTLQTGQPLDMGANVEIAHRELHWEIVVGGAVTGRFRGRFSIETGEKLVDYLSPESSAN